VPDPTIVVNFGQPDHGVFFRGVRLDVTDEPVHPVASGVVVLVSRSTGDQPVIDGLGNYVAIHHEHGFLTIYAHLDDESLPGIGEMVDTTTTIGMVDSSGAVTSRTLDLYVYDLVEQRNVNPLLLLPDLEDTIRPAVDTLTATRDGVATDLTSGEPVLPGTYELIADTFDRWSRGGHIVIPYTVTMYVDGREEFTMEMEQISAVDGVARVSPATRETASELFDTDGRLRLGSVIFSEGTTRVELVVTDFAGNESSIDYEVHAEYPPDEDVQQTPGG
jgi:hypothetical protein